MTSQPSRYRVVIEPAAHKALNKFDRPVRGRIYAALANLQADPRPAGVVAMVGWPGYLRLRVGDYRVIYTVRDAEVLVFIVKAGHRRDIY